MSFIPFRFLVGARVSVAFSNPTGYRLTIPLHLSTEIGPTVVAMRDFHRSLQAGTRPIWGIR